MCRLLLLYNPQGVEPGIHLEAFKSLSRNSREYQGDGWGCAWLDPDGGWQIHHSIQPVWEDRRAFPPTRLFLAHARSAFRNEGIAVENNMPFDDSRYVFAFNGELRGVRLNMPGRIGAEKIFNTIRNFDHGDITAATRRGVMVLNKRSRYIRAMNFFLADPGRIIVYSQFSEDPEYFQLRTITVGDLRVFCSETYDLPAGQWQALPNGSIEVIDLPAQS